MPDQTSPQLDRPARVLVLGGARSGKSTWAEERLSTDPTVTYVASAAHDPDDPEWVVIILLVQ